jgi:AraC family transcriptional regulator
MTLRASTLTVGWNDTHAVILDGSLETGFDFPARSPIIMFNLKGSTRVEWRRAGRYSRFQTKPGDILITPPGDRHSLRTYLPVEVLAGLIDSKRLETLAEREWQPSPATVEVVETFNKNDGDLWNLGRRLADHLRAPVSGSRLYAETLNTQIAIHLLWNYSSLPRPSEDRPEPLADQRLRRVIDYIHGTLGDDVSLDALAEVAGLSPNYFLVAFKQATGRTPHRYVIEQRIAKACDLLHNPRSSITEVSLAVGFSSQSHLTEVFRRYMKTTPAAYRKEVLGLARELGDPNA